jgi:hypothetical protein
MARSDVGAVRVGEGNRKRANGKKGPERNAGADWKPETAEAREAGSRRLRRVVFFFSDVSRWRSDVTQGYAQQGQPRMHKAQALPCRRSRTSRMTAQAVGGAGWQTRRSTVCGARCRC